MKKEPIIVNVYLWGTCIGKLNWDFEKHIADYEDFDIPYGMVSKSYFVC